MVLDDSNADSETTSNTADNTGNGAGNTAHGHGQREAEISFANWCCVQIAVGHDQAEEFLRQIEGRT